MFKTNSAYETVRPYPVQPGDFIAIPAWSVEGMVLDVNGANIGSDDAIEVLLQTSPDDEKPRRYRLEPGEYEITLVG